MGGGLNADSSSAPSRRRESSLLFQSALALAVVLAVVAIAVALDSRIVSAIKQARDVAVQAQAWGNAAHAVLDALRDAEAGQRGFLMTHRAPYLAPYEDGRRRLAHSLAELDKAAEQALWLRDPVEALHAAADRKMADLGRTLALDRERGPQAALAEVLTDAGQAAMDAARDQAGWIEARATEERERQVAAIRASERAAARGVLAAACLGALLLGGAVLVLLRGRAGFIRAEKARLVQRARLAATLANLPDGIAVFDAAGRLLLCNAAMIEVTGLPGRLAREGSEYADFAAAAAAWPGEPLSAIEAHPPGAAAGIETHVGGRVLEIRRGIMPDGGQMLVIADITRRAEAETIARQAQKMEALGQLTGGVAHDFNNLLQVISTNLELMRPRVGPEPFLAARLAEAMAGVERAARLTRHLLAFARRQPLAPEAIDPRRLLVGFEDMLRRTLGDSVALEMVLGGGLWPVRADPQQLENALLNLAINGRDAMQGGSGTLTFEAGNATLDDRYAAAHAEITPGQYVVIGVSDTGIGMTPEQLARATEPFYTTKPDGRGTGLGLSMVFGFARQSGGHLTLYSEPGHGTTARLYLPRSMAAPRADPEPAAVAGSGRGETVLVVEDDPTVRAASVQALHELGYRTLEAGASAAALAILEGGARPDLLFTDVMMPGAPATREMARRACAMLPGLVVVYTSGYTENAIVHNGQLDPGVILVSKPWRSAELARKLRLALDGGGRGRPAKLRIVLVEDEMLVRMTTADILADLGHEVVQAATGAEALDAVRAGADLLIADLGLPDMDGMDVVRAARAALPRLRVVMASGSDAEDGENVVWLAKPYDQAALVEAIERTSPDPATRSPPRPAQPGRAPPGEAEAEDDAARPDAAMRA